MRRLVLFLVGGILMALLAAAAAGYVLYGRVHTPFRGYAGGEEFVEIPPGASSREIGDRLIASGVVRDRLTYRAALWLSGSARRLRAGEYRFDRPMTAADVVDQVARGEVFVVPITFPEGLTIAEMARVFATRGLGEASAFVAEARNAALVADLDPDARDLEGYLFPDTYTIPRKTGAAAIVRQMVTQFTRELTPDLRRAAAAQGLSVRELVTLASIIEKETGLAEERPIVASVYANRLKLGMGLQCDPTVIYALAREGRYTGNLRRQDLAFDSPYNTYRYRGLPPGPIASPGRASLEAAAAPASTAFLYFVSRNDGSHVFARTLAEHNRNVTRYQRLRTGD
jgi:UPF0755 protein